jgi:predicted flap endonuclease-1-like 5' DNA nuclease
MHLMCNFESLASDRSLKARMWDTERGKLLRQLEGIGDVICFKLAEAAGIKTFQVSMELHSSR